MPFRATLDSIGLGLPTLELLLDDIAFPIYRYTKSIFHASFNLQGTVRLGTLYGYHDVTSLGPEIGDDTEGLKLELGVGSDTAPVLVAGSSINCWMMSFCAARDDRFYDLFKADCCLEITDKRYFIEIAKAARVYRPRLGSLFAMRYGNIATGHDPNGEAPFLMQWKEPRFSWQNEIRFALEPWSLLSPLFLKSVPARETLTVNSLVKQELKDRAYNNARFFPNLKPVFVSAPDAKPYVRVIETRPLSSS